jgi:predicted alpha/beta superfamily hydrolase/DNA-binding beta-propeller fold protein YncE
MKKTLFVLLLICFTQASAAEKPKPLVVGETFTIHSRILNENRRINVYQPPGYTQPGSARLPVLYMPDGGIAEDFLHIAGLVQVSVSNQTMRPFLLVGIENTQRRRDLTGPTDNENDKKIAPHVGGSELFRRFIRDELMPQVKLRYRTTDETAIVGESLAALFVIESFFLEPELFDTYIAIDPSLWWNDQKLLNVAAARLRDRANLEKTLYFASSNESGEATQRLADIFSQNASSRTHWHYEKMPDEKHSTIFHPAAVKAFRTVFKPANSTQSTTCLPTGVCLDPAGRSFAAGNMPLAMVLSPEGDRLVLSLNGWRQQGIQVIDRHTGAMVQTITQPSAFLGLAFSHDGRTLYASGGNEDVVYRYAWRDKQATLIDSIVLAPKEPKKDGTRFPAGIAVSHDNKYLFVAENLGDSLAVVNLETKRVVQRLQTEAYPYAVVVSPADEVYVSAWGGQTVSAFAVEKGALKERGRISVGRHPSALLLNRNGSRLFVASASTNSIAVINTQRLSVVTRLLDPPPAGPNQGSTPNALALSPDESRLYVAEADNNAVAVFQLATNASRLLGRIPVEWYPADLLVTQDSLLVLNGKGKGSRANPQFPTPDVELSDDSTAYTLGQLNGTITALPAQIKQSELLQLTQRVARANNWNRAPGNAEKYPPFKHVIYIIKENRTYDQVLGDLSQGDGDTSLVFFPRPISPNHHALAERFGLFDRFFCNAEVSSQGHVWSTAGYVTDYGEKTIPSLYSDRRNGNDRGDVDEPAFGYIWNAAIKKGLTLRNYGEFGEPEPKNPARYRAVKPALDRYTSREYPAYDLNIMDQIRVGVWLREFQEFVRQGSLPALQIMHLPGDHTSGGRPGRRTPKAYMADNDLALGRMVEAVSNSPYWKDTVFFVLEDDAQDGPDHVDSHRSVLLVISAYNRGGVIHRFVNTTDVLATIEEILGLSKLSKFDYYGHPLQEIFANSANLTPYVALKPEHPLDELNPPKNPSAQASLELKLDRVDAANEDTFNRVLWSLLKPGQPYPGTKRMSSLEITRAR